MTPVEFVEALREMHEPYIPEVVEVVEGEAREPTLDDKASTLDMWCDGCRTTAVHCLVAPLLERVDSHDA